MLLYIWLCVGVAALWLFLRKRYSFFKSKEVNHLPVVPILGHLTRPILRLEHGVTAMKRQYFAFPEDKFVGSFEFINPSVMVRDPELIRLIGIKDFDHFGDHRSFTGDKDPFFSKSLFGLKGQKWRDMRSTLSPAFTGSKLRGMVPFIQECSNGLVEYINCELKKSNNGCLDLDTKDLFTRYANDVIATCAFGLKVNSIAEKNHDFYEMGRKLTSSFFELKQILKMFLIMTLPFIDKIGKISVFPQEPLDYLGNIVLTTMKNRDENKIFRSDVIQLLIEAKKGTLAHENVEDEKDAGFATVEESEVGKGAIKRVWTDEDLVAQALLFFFAGFDTVSTSMVFLLYELAVNPDIQTRLRQEIDDCYENNQEKIDYDTLNRMKYMDMVFAETLRKWPPAVSTDRVCLKRYNMGKPHNKAKNDFYLEKGDAAIIPIWPLHYDPKYYPEPEKFDPERFSDENKHNIQPFTYLPFGIGPRNCIGSRFALTEVKAMAFDLLRHFELSPGPKTTVPAQLDPSTFATRMLGGHWLRISPRKGQ